VSAALKSSGNEITDASEDVAAEFERLCFSGDLNDTDRRILKFIFANPDASHDEIATAVGYSRSGVTRRVNRMPFIRARMLFEGTVADKMQRAVFKLARNVEKILDDYIAAPDPGELFAKLRAKGMKEEAAERIAELSMRSTDPRIMLEAGKIAVGWVAKQAELDVLAQKRDAKPEDLPTLEEARKILSEDPAQSDVIEAEVEDL
jgi:hypothetical protein